MKHYNITYSYRMSDEIQIEAKNEKDALKQFRKLFPDVDFDDVWELSEETYYA